MKKLGFFDLPDETLAYIFNFLNKEEASQTARTSKRILQVLSSFHPQYKSIYTGITAIKSSSDAYFHAWANKLNKKEYYYLLILMGEGHISLTHMEKFWPKEMLNPILSEYGLTAFREKLVTMDDIDHCYTDTQLQAIFSEPGIAVLRIGCTTIEKIIALPINTIEDTLKKVAAAFAQAETPQPKI